LDGKDLGYRQIKSKEDLTRRYVQLWKEAWKLKDDPGLSAAVYTQWTDVETECNGLLTYDRKIVKVDPRQAIAAHQGRFGPVIEGAAPTRPKQPADKR
jgi:hypothetical protein